MREWQRHGEFIISEGNGTLSRDEGVLVERADAFRDGTFLMRSGDELAEWNTPNVSDIVGILCGFNPTEGRPEIERRCVYVARLAEVHDEALLYGADADDEWRNAIRQELLDRLHIVTRISGVRFDEQTETEGPDEADNGIALSGDGEPDFEGMSGDELGFIELSGDQRT